MLVSIPLFIQISKGEDGKQYRLNLNCYRNWHYQTSDKIKKRFCQQLEHKLAGVRFEMPVEIRFTLYKSTRRKVDRSNVLSIVEKFFCDALVHYGCIADDNDEYIAATHYRTGGIDRECPRVEIEVNEVIPIYSQMRPIPAKHKKIIDQDPFYRACCLTGMRSSSFIKIDIHHCWKYAGQQINELWAYMPVWERKHSAQGDPDSVHNCRETKERVQYLSLLRATKEDLAKYPKKNWQQELNYLSKKYGGGKTHDRRL